MTLGSCSREEELRTLLKQGHWPQASTVDLQAHVAACRSCSETVLVTATFQASRTHTAAVAVLPSPGLLWWRAQLRRRNTNMERIARPLLGAQIFALAVTFLAGTGFLAWQLPRGSSVWQWIEQLPHALRLDTAALLGSGGTLWLLVPALATLALLGGVAVYWSSEKQ